MSKTFVTKTKNGFGVYVDTETSHAATHLKNHPELFEYLKEILAEHEARENEVRFETDLGRVVGTMDRVETAPDDDVFYAKRPNREKYTRFVRGKQPVPTTFVTTELRKSADSEHGDVEFEVFTVFIGRLTPSFPSGKDDPDEQAREFWRTQALVVGEQDFLPETVTKECPW